MESKSDITKDGISAFETAVGASPENPVALIGDVQGIASGTVLAFDQALLAKNGQPGQTVLGVGLSSSGVVQGVSLADGNVIEVYASGADFNTGNVMIREFMQRGEPIALSGVPEGGIITSAHGFYGFSENPPGAGTSPMPLLSYGLAFDFTMFFAFRASNLGTATVVVINGAIGNSISLKDSFGAVVLGQEDIQLEPWEHTLLGLDGNKEYILQGANPLMAGVASNTQLTNYIDLRLIMPLTDDGITWPKNGFVSAPFPFTEVPFWTRDGVTGTINSNLGTGVSPGSPVDFDAAVGIGTGASDVDYEPNGATRIRPVGVVSAYSGADSGGGDATPLMPVSSMSQTIAQPFFIRAFGDGGNSGIAIASPYEGEVKVFAWNYGTDSLDLAYTMLLERGSGVVVTGPDDQNYPAAALLSLDTNATQTLVGDLNPGIIVADVPITVVAQTDVFSVFPTIRVNSVNNEKTFGPSAYSSSDETLMLGITPPIEKAELTRGTDGIIYKRVVGPDAAGLIVETWRQA